MRGAPAQLAPQLGGVDGVAAVMPGAVGHVVEVIGVVAHGLHDHPQHVDVAALAVRTDEVGLLHLATGQDGPNSAGVVLDVDPVADVLPGAVELGPDSIDDVGDLPRDELLHVLVVTIVVGTV